MGNSLGFLLANIIMAKLEQNVFKRFIDDKIIMFYNRFPANKLRNNDAFFSSFFGYKQT